MSGIAPRLDICLEKSVYMINNNTLVFLAGEMESASTRKNDTIVFFVKERESASMA